MQATMSGGRLAAAVAAAAAAILVTGCATAPQPFAARVTTFQQWPGTQQGATYRFATPAGGENLERRTYEDVIRAAIGRTGLVEAPAGTGAARFSVDFDYRTEPFQSYAEVPGPYYGAPMFSYGYFGGRRGPGWGYGMMFPFGGFYDYGYQAVPVTAYRHSLEVTIRDVTQGNAQVYQARATHNGGADALPEVMPYLAQAIFDGFPQNNGQTQTVRVPRGG